MKPGVPWSVKGIQPQARETAKEAAQKAGLTLGQWLNQTILHGQHDGRRAKQARKSSSRGKPAGGNTVDARFDELSRKLDMLVDGSQNDNEPEWYDEPESPDSAPIEGLIEHLVRSESKTDSAIDALRYDLSRIAGRMDAVPAPPPTADFGGMTAIEKTLGDVVGHIELTDRRNAEVLRTIQSRLSELSTRVVETGSGVDADTITTLDRRLGDIASRLETQEISHNPKAYKTLEAQIADLNKRMQQSRAGAQKDPAVTALEARYNQLADKLSVTERLVPTRDEMNNLKQRFDDLQNDISKTQSPVQPSALRALEGRMGTLAAEVNQMRTGSVDPTQFDAFGKRLEDVQHRLIEAEKGLTANAEFGAVTGRLEDIQARLQRAEQSLGNAPDIQTVEARFDEIQQRVNAAERGLDNLPDSTALESRLSELSRRLDQSVTGDRIDPQIEKLDSRVNEILNRLDKEQPEPEMSAFKDLEAQINRIGDRLEETEERFDAPLQSIQANLSQLYESLESSRNSAVQAAEQAAVKAAQKIIAGQSGADGGASDAITALERSLTEVRTQVSSADQRTQDTLEAVHDTLKRVIDRMAAMEERGLRLSSEETDDGGDAGSFDDFRLPPLPEIPATMATPEPAITPDFQEAAPAVPREVDGLQFEAPESAGQGPEPSGGGEKSEDGVNFFAQAYEDDKGESTRNGDFIAAARRAAQAANRESLAGEEAKQAKSTKSSLFSFGKSKKRAVLYAAAVVFLAVGALSMTGVVNNGGKTRLASPSNTGSVPVDGKMKQEPDVPAARAFSYVPDLSSDRTTEMAPSSVNGHALSIEPVTRGDRVASFGVTGPGKNIAGQFAKGPQGGTVAAPGEIALAPTKFLNRAPAVVPSNAARPVPDNPPVTAPVRPELAFGLPPESVGGEALRQSAANGNASAQFEVGARFADGRAGKADNAKAAVWYQRAAAQGHPSAQYRLGTLYEKGRGVQQDVNAARNWYERAAESGNRKAMHNLAVLLASTSLGQPDFTRAARWFHKAAEFGLADSQFNLGILHERGLGVEADEAKAYKWFRVAAAAGDKDAKIRATKLESTMAADILATARAAAAAWRARTPDPAANVIASSKTKWARGKPKVAKAAPTVRSSRVLVARAQLLLGELGYDPGPADGLTGPKTRLAIETFERERGLPVTGGASVNIVRALEAAAG